MKYEPRLKADDLLARRPVKKSADFLGHRDNLGRIRQTRRTLSGKVVFNKSAGAQFGNTQKNFLDRNVQQPPMQSTSTVEQNPSHNGYAHAAIEERHSPASGRFSLVAIMVGIFAMGAAAGLIATSWIQKSSPDRGVLSERVVSKPVGPASTVSTGKEVINSKPIDEATGELPYDGKEQERESLSSVSPLPLESATSEQGDVKESSALPLSQTKDAPQLTRDATKNINPTSKHHFSNQVAKDKEIQRIQQQATEELKKKIEDDDLGGSTEKNKQVHQGKKQESRGDYEVHAASRRPLLAKCERAANFILKERCKWDICSGMWGKNGCPSYEKQASWF